jgi:hypothetical protein
MLNKLTNTVPKSQHNVNIIKLFQIDKLCLA